MAKLYHGDKISGTPKGNCYETEKSVYVIILKIILAVILIAACAGIAALIAELTGKRTSGRKPYGIYERFIKRPLDAALATGAFIVFSPVLLITAVLVRIRLGSPIIFSQIRAGREEKPFKVYKFRTMTDQRDAQGELMPDEIRLTSFGRKLRASSLDELPELINIIKGDMAVVGPRPLHMYYLPWYTEEQHKRHGVRPGLTGYAQAHGRNAVEWDDKLQMDVDYARRITFAGDLAIILDTVKAVLRHEGISPDASSTMEDFRRYCESKGRKPIEAEKPLA